MFYPEFSKRFASAIDSLVGPIAVLGHAHPDGDCLGSQVALCRLLQALGKDACVVNNNKAPRVLAPFVGDTPYLLPDQYETSAANAVVCDCADYARIGQTLVKRFPNTHICIDHHITNNGYSTENFIDSKSAATCEILAGMIFDCNMPIDITMADALYVGIITDTGMFRFPSTSNRVFKIASRLLDIGVEPGRVSNLVYESESPAKIKLLQYFLASLKQEFNGRICIGTLPNGTYEACGAETDDSEGLVDYARCIDGVDIGVLLEERGTVIKGSLRAKTPDMRVDQIAALFGGGGHACAAGFSTEGTIESFYSELAECIKSHLKAI